MLHSLCVPTEESRHCLPARLFSGGLVGEVKKERLVEVEIGMHTPKEHAHVSAC